MLIPFPPIQVPACTHHDWVARPQVHVRPRRILLDRHQAKSFVITDIKIGKNSQTACYGEIPGDIFAADLDRADKGDGYIILPDLPACPVGFDIRLSVMNIDASMRNLRGAIDAEVIEEPFEVGSLILKGRHPISISAHGERTVVACNDGTMWERFKADGNWKLIPPIPKDDIKKHL